MKGTPNTRARSARQRKRAMGVVMHDVLYCRWADRLIAEMETTMADIDRHHVDIEKAINDIKALVPQEKETS